MHLKEKSTQKNKTNFLVFFYLKPTLAIILEFQ